MASHPAIRLISSSKSALSKIYLNCHVKPGASKQREGIISISESTIEVCVSAQAREGEANKATREVFSSILKCPKSDVEVVRGMKSRDKTVAICRINVQGDEKKCICNIRAKLEEAVFEN